MGMELKNLMEELVIQKYNDMIKDMDCCKCEHCRLDVLSHTLNELPPRYVVSTKGELFAKCNNLTLQFDTNIITELTKSFNLVHNNPRHDN